jgi:hypothetical protein
MVLCTSTEKLFEMPLIISASASTKPVATAARTNRRIRHCRSLRLVRSTGRIAPEWVGVASAAG